MLIREDYEKYLRKYEAECRADGVDVILTECRDGLWQFEYYQKPEDKYDRSLELFGVLHLMAGALNIGYTGAEIVQRNNVSIISMYSDMERHIYDPD